MSADVTSLLQVKIERYVWTTEEDAVFFTSNQSKKIYVTAICNSKHTKANVVLIKSPETSYRIA